MVEKIKSTSNTKMLRFLCTPKRVLVQEIFTFLFCRMFIRKEYTQIKRFYLIPLEKISSKRISVRSNSIWSKYLTLVLLIHLPYGGGTLLVYVHAMWKLRDWRCVELFGVGIKYLTSKWWRLRYLTQVSPDKFEPRQTSIVPTF